MMSRPSSRCAIHSVVTAWRRVPPAADSFCATPYLRPEHIALASATRNCLIALPSKAAQKSRTHKNENSRLGAWQAVSITVGNGIGILVAGYSLEKLSGVLAATVVFIVFLTPLLVFLVIPCPPPSNELVGKAFGRFVNEVAVLIKRREMLIAMALFTAPSASFALTNVIGGWGANLAISGIPKGQLAWIAQDFRRER